MTIAETFHRVRERRELALMPYVMAGFPDLDRSLQIMQLLSKNGADLLEIGVPFSDPVADGVTIQAASQAALSSGFRLQKLLAGLRRIRLECPAVLMSYLNPLLVYGRDALLNDMIQARLTGLIIPDLPHDEADDWRDAARRAGIAMIFLVAPTSPEDRIRRICEAAEGFIYAVSLTGITGARAELDPSLPAYLARIRTQTDKPIAVGFGVARPDHIRALHGIVDGVVIGSRIIQATQDGEDLARLTHEFKQATRR